MITFLNFAFGTIMSGIASILVLWTVLSFVAFIFRETLRAIITWKDLSQQTIEAPFESECSCPVVVLYEKKRIKKKMSKFSYLIKNILLGMVVVIVIAAGACFIVAALEAGLNSF